MAVDAHGVADEAQLLCAYKSADLEVSPAHKQCVQCAVARALVQVRIVGEIVYNDQNLVEGSQLHLLAGLRDLSLLANNLAQRRLVSLLEVGLLPVGWHFHGLLDVLLHGAPAVVHVEHIDSFEAAPVLLKNHADESHRLARFAGSKQPMGQLLGTSEEAATAVEGWEAAVVKMAAKQAPAMAQLQERFQSCFKTSAQRIKFVSSRPR